MLAAAALISLRPWETNSVTPQLRVSPEVEAGLGDAIALAPGRSAVSPAVAGAQVAAYSIPAIEPVTVREPAPISRIGISPGRALSDAQPVSLPAPPPPEPQAPPIVPVVALPEPVPPAPAVPPVAPAAPHLVADFENGMEGWSTAATSEVTPRLVSGIVRDGERSSLVRLTGTRSRSQLILGGDGDEGDEGVVQIHEGDEYAFAFSFYIQTMTYGEPGVDNAILRLTSDASETSAFGLQLWNPAVGGQDGERGLWSSGEAVGGDRFLAPVPELEWHDAIVHFRASSQGAGFYAVYLDGELVDARDAVSMIVPGSSYVQIEVGLHRSGEQVAGTSEIRIDAAKLGPTLESVQPLAE
ncbi:MAG TPA: heparin lyase I family protein [Solirubrobacterales bacterium]|nr:heparin lyase I family protein [Solirubrobacterales bacterium]